LNGWFEVGNLFRSNTGSDAPVGIIVHVRHRPVLRGGSVKDLPAQTNGGLVMPLIENNRFSGVQSGVILNQGNCWALVRNNAIQTTAAGGPAVYDDSGGKATDAMILSAVKDVNKLPLPPK
jgi:hypothetical protein